MPSGFRGRVSSRPDSCYFFFGIFFEARRGALSTGTSNDSERSVTTADPLTLFLQWHRRALPARRGGKRFNAGEHAWLAGHGAERACEELARKRDVHVDKDLFASISRRDGREQLQYGELVALSGDFYESPEALFNETPSPLPWLWESNDLSDLRQIFKEELRWIEDRRQGHGGASSYPDENIRLAWNAKSYVELALRNTDHFGWHCLRVYLRNHAEAMRLAASTGGRNDETFRRALYTTAFADHFLTDAFAAGHIRVPRAEIRTWAEGRGLSEKIAGALSKVIHDEDGHVDLSSLHGVVDENHRPAEDGLLVQDSTGATWRTRCDGQLFLDTAATQSPAVDRAVAAVSASVCEFLLAWKRRELPAGIYAATQFMPFPHPDAPTLIQKFPADLAGAEIDRLWNSVTWYTKIPWLVGLKREHLRDLFTALPQIMVDFRAHIAAEVDANAELGARTAPSYIAAYKKIA
jgi:hypothetical protein